MAKFEMDTEFVRKLAQVLHETNLGEIELADGERRIRIARPSVTVAAPVAAASTASSAASARGACGGRRGQRSRQASRRGEVAHGRHRLSRARARQANFVSVGDKVTAGQTLLIIEAMKTFNPIKAPRAGRVAQILIDNAQPVEFEQPLMIVE